MKPEKISIYTPFQIQGMNVKNRLVKSAMYEFGADNGKITPEIIHIYEQAAKGGIGLIITGMQAVSAGGGIGPAMVQSSYETYCDDMKKLADVVHVHGSKLLVQLQHAGQRTYWKGGYDTFAVTDIPMSDEFSYHEATTKELEQVVKNFGIAAQKCKAAGCDGVQIHAAHGFLINSFLSPQMNKRTDSYGVSIENRAKLLFEIYHSIRNAVGNHFIVSVKIPFSDLVENSSTPEEMIWVCKELEKKGIDMIEVSSGMVMDGSNASFTPLMKDGDAEGKFLDGAAQIANQIKIPVISVCNYRSPDFIEYVLNNTKISAISLGRPLVREPNLPNRWKTDRRPAKCISCNRCYGSQNIISCQLVQQ